MNIQQKKQHPPVRKVSRKLNKKPYMKGAAYAAPPAICLFILPTHQSLHIHPEL